MTYIRPSWPAPKNIKACTTTRYHGQSVEPYSSNNLAHHVGDNTWHTKANRLHLEAALQLPSSPFWLEQTHSTESIIVEDIIKSQGAAETSRPIADAAITRDPKRVLAILTADCLPILLCNKEGSEIAAIHAGWRGLVNGIIENTLAKMQSDPSEILAWCGPAICQSCYEVGEEVYEAYRQRYPFASRSFQRRGIKFLANVPELAELVLKKLSVSAVYQSNLCTFEQKNAFYSYRREQKTGRIASLIWFHKE